MEDDEYKTSNQNYYNIAHSSAERVIEQPSLLVGGSLKEYQVTAEQMHYIYGWATIKLFLITQLHTHNHLTAFFPGQPG